MVPDPATLSAIAAIDAKRRAEMDAGRARLREAAPLHPSFNPEEFERQLQASDEVAQHDEELRAHMLFGAPLPDENSIDALLASLEK